jgi:aldose 1-epimerase
MSVEIEQSRFGAMPDGTPVEAFTLGATGGVSVRVLTLGGILQSVSTPDRSGRPADITLGYDDVAGYLGGRAYMGAIIGRVAGRLAGGRIEIDGRAFELSRNEGENTLHGGVRGFDGAIWRVLDAGTDDRGAFLRLAHHSPAGDQGFPGALEVTADLRLHADGRLTLDLGAVSDAPTVVNLTWHPYWNLAGGGRIDDHLLMVGADEAFVMGPDLIPARSPSPVDGSALDLRQPRAIGDVAASEDAAVRVVGGLDHLFVLGGGAPAARLLHPASGRSLTIESPAEAIVAYGGGGLGGAGPGKGGAAYAARAGVALEPQGRPDRLAILRPGQTWRWSQTLTFGTDA